VIVRAPSGHPVGDATNYLGGLGDVLQDRSKPVNLDLSHLGELQGIALYLNDRQISSDQVRRRRGRQLVLLRACVGSA
jgi:hypothetical protein